MNCAVICAALQGRRRSADIEILHTSLGAALKGRRFNWPGLETLYLSLSFKTAFREVSAGFAHRLTPHVLCSYDVDCEDIADLRTETGRAEHNVAFDDLACAWGEHLSWIGA